VPRRCTFFEITAATSLSNHISFFFDLRLTFRNRLCGRHEAGAEKVLEGEEKKSMVDGLVACRFASNGASLRRSASILRSIELPVLICKCPEQGHASRAPPIVHLELISQSRAFSTMAYHRPKCLAPEKSCTARSLVSRNSSRQTSYVSVPTSGLMPCLRIDF
jgi:hypothetical protein